MNGLNRDKATGLENLLIEYFVKFKDIFQPSLVRLFYCILYILLSFLEFDHGELLYHCTKRGDTNDTTNYRGITLVSNLMAKIFTSVLNNVLLDWASANDVISDAQFGFKPWFGIL